MQVGSPSISVSDDEVDSQGNLKGFIDDADQEISEESVRKDLRYFFEQQKRRKNSIESPGDLKRLRGRTRFQDMDVEAGSVSDKICRTVKALDSIVRREKEAREMLAMMMQPEGGVRPLLVGPAGIGKMSIINKIASLIKYDTQVAPLIGKRKILCVDCNQLLADSIGDNYVQGVSDRLREIVGEWVTGRDNPPILYFRDIEKLINLDQITEVVQLILKEEIPFIASISEDAGSDSVNNSMKILEKYKFQVVEVKESPITDVVEIVKNYLMEFPPVGEVQITMNAIKLAVRLAGKYVHNRPFPMKAISLVQECINGVLMNHGMKKVTSKEIVQLVSAKTGVPEADLFDDAVFDEARFAERLNQKIIGQEHAIEMVSQRVASYKLGLLNRNKPWGVFLFAGPTGVGKTELAKQLARFLFNDENNLIVINGSEYREEYTLSNLIGSPKGYEGNDSGGLLTGPLLKNPHQVVLLDEFEKAHPDVRMLFLQVFDQGSMMDRRGMRVDCTQALFIMTSNVGSDLLFSKQQGGHKVEMDELMHELKPMLVQTFSPELCNRFSAIIPFMPLEHFMLPDLARVSLENIAQRLKAQAGIDFSWTPELINYFTHCDIDVRFGMRHFCKMVDETVVSVIKDAMLRSDRRLAGKMQLTNVEGQFQLKISKVGLR